MSVFNSPFPENKWRKKDKYFNLFPKEMNLFWELSRMKCLYLDSAKIKTGRSTRIKKNETRFLEKQKQDELNQLQI